MLVEVRAVSVNPVDVKVRAGFGASDQPKILGFDAAGVVRATGSDVAAFAPGDEVYYAGSIARTGSNAGLQLVDSRARLLRRGRPGQRLPRSCREPDPHPTTSLNWAASVIFTVGVTVSEG
ncbi:alcohol dehydrogenase catalytic domain-containing protein [Pseudonocardia sp. GCM10023141]|uniref:alcohol dehydrogenase catalytic domain-containing protein n=1 Tax=Pseudonocardia sp. GCM10023141 TaxID=3252653 RepID=UPI0036070508